LSGVLADGERLPFGPETFDLILSGSTFQWYGNWEPSLKKTYQSIKPQGVLAFSQFCYPSLEPLKSISESLGRSQSFLPLMEYDEILGSLSKTFQGAPLKSQCLERCLYFDTPRSVFDHLRALGVTANGANHRPWTASQWRKACDALEKERVVEGIPLRYCIGLYWLMVL
jgi:malonyl-CoA O-methyltransferase